VLYFRRYLCHRINELIDEYNCQPPFLEVGCGTGTALEWLTSKIGKGVGIEVSKEAIKIAHERVKNQNLNVSLLEESLFEHQGKYRTVLAIDVLEHFPANIEALRKMREFMTDDGLLILFVPAGPYMKDDVGFGHSCRYTAPSLAACLHEANLEVRALAGFGFPFLTFARVLKNRFAFALPPADRKFLLANSLKSSYTNPFIGSIWEKLYNTFEKTYLGRTFVDASLHCELRSRSFTGAAHSILCVAGKDLTKY